MYADDLRPHGDGEAAGSGDVAGRISIAFEDEEGEWIRMAGQKELEEAMW